MENTFFKDLEEADMVLVGLGSEWDALKDTFLSRDEEEVVDTLEGTEYSWLIPAYMDSLREEHDNGRIRDAVARLEECLRGKNYFIVSQAQNSDIYHANWREGRLVMPCGGAFRKQCGLKCDVEHGSGGHPGVSSEGNNTSILSEEEKEKLGQICRRLPLWLKECTAEEHNNLMAGQDESALSPEVRMALLRIGKRSRGEAATKALKERIPEGVLGTCPHCGRDLILNAIQSGEYDETGYLPDWERYTKWLQGTVNRRLLVLELGVGMEYPGMIRIPFERVTFLNQKAKIYRVHQNLYQLTEKLAEKGVGISENAIDWLANL